MRHKINKIVALLLLASFISSCSYHHVRTDRRSPGHHKYRKAGRDW